MTAEIEIFDYFEFDRASLLDRGLSLRAGYLNTQGDKIHLAKKLEEGKAQVMLTLDKTDAIKGINHILFSLWCDLQEANCADTANCIVYQHNKTEFEVSNRLLASIK